MKLIVKTIDKKEFSSICQELYAMIDQNNLTHLIFIENGGTYIFKELDGKISEMLSVNRPVIFDCVVDKTENCYPMIPSGKPHNQMLLGKQDEEDEISDEGKVLV